MTNLELAYQLHDLGYSLLPVSAETKRPVVKWKQLQTMRCNREKLVDWFSVHDYRVGVITGELSGIVVVDADDNIAEQSVLYHCDESPMGRATKRGAHFYYKHPGFRVPNTVGCLGCAIDVRGDGGYVLADDGLLGIGEDLPEYDPFWLNHHNAISSLEAIA